MDDLHLPKSGRNPQKWNVSFPVVDNDYVSVNALPSFFRESGGRCV